jgi:phosphoglycolate phosphatase
MTILFDLDGTLIDTAPDFIAAINQLRNAMSLSPLSNTALTQIRFAVAEGIKAIAQVGFECISESNNPALCQQLLDTYQQNLGTHAKPFPGIENLLETLDEQQIRWGIVTNKQARFTEPLLRSLGLSDRAACIVSGDTTAHCKPHPAPLLHACHKPMHLYWRC